MLRSRHDRRRSAASGRFRWLPRPSRSSRTRLRTTLRWGTRARKLSPKIFASRITRAAPRMFPVMMRLIKPGTSMRVGQAIVQGASKQYRQRAASISSLPRVHARSDIRKISSYCSGSQFRRVSRRGIRSPHASAAPLKHTTRWIFSHRASGPASTRHSSIATSSQSRTKLRACGKSRMHRQPVRLGKVSLPSSDANEIRFLPRSQVDSSTSLGMTAF